MRDLPDTAGLSVDPRTEDQDQVQEELFTASARELKSRAS